MNHEERIDDALSDFDSLILEGSDVEMALKEAALGNELQPAFLQRMVGGILALEARQSRVLMEEKVRKLVQDWFDKPSFTFMAFEDWIAKKHNVKLDHVELEYSRTIRSAASAQVAKKYLGVDS